MRIRVWVKPAVLVAGVLLAGTMSVAVSGEGESAMDAAVEAAKDKAADTAKDMVREKATDLVADMAAKADAATAKAEAPARPEMSPEMAAMFEAYRKAGALGPQHEQLKFFEGRWTAAVSMWFGPGEPTRGEASASTSMALGGRFAHMHYEGEWMGEPFHGLAYTGYDNVNQRFTSLWADSASTWFAVMYGDHDADSRTYTFTGMMPNPLDATSPTPVREVMRIVDDNRYTVEWFEPHDGEEVRTMLIEFTRVTDADN